MRYKTTQENPFLVSSCIERIMIFSPFCQRFLFLVLFYGYNWTNRTYSIHFNFLLRKRIQTKKDFSCFVSAEKRIRSLRISKSFFIISLQFSFFFSLVEIVEYKKKRICRRFHTDKSIRIGLFIKSMDSSFLVASYSTYWHNSEYYVGMTETMNQSIDSIIQKNPNKKGIE